MILGILSVCLKWLKPDRMQTSKNQIYGVYDSCSCSKYILIFKNHLNLFFGAFIWKYTISRVGMNLCYEHVQCPFIARYVFKRILYKQMGNLMLHKQKWSFPLRISSVNVTKPQLMENFVFCEMSFLRNMSRAS